MNFESKIKSEIASENKIIRANFFSSIYTTNLGDDTAIVNDNIPIEAGNAWKFENLPHVTIDQDFSIIFAGVETSKKVLVETVYNKERK